MDTSSETVPLSEFEALKEQNAKLKIELAELKRLIFGQKSERHVPAPIPQQETLALEGPCADNTPEPQYETINYDRKKPSKRRSAGGIEIRAELPVKRKLLKPEADVSGMKKIREETVRVLEYEPPKFFWIDYVSEVFAPASGIGSFVKAPVPFRPIERGLPGPMFSTQVVIDKYVDHTPVYRQIRKYGRMGVVIADSTIDGWIGKYAELMKPLYECAKKEVLKTDYLQADETTLKVLKVPKTRSGKPHNGFLVPYHAPVEKAVFFEYMAHRNQNAQASLLSGFKGFLQTDGHNCYDKVAARKDIIHLGCMYHARRNFEKALHSNKPKAEYALRVFRLLAAVERKCQCPDTGAVDCDKRRKLRERHSVKIMRIFKMWLDETIRLVTPKSLLAKAINYVLNRWIELNVYLTDAKLEISNNLIENLIRPIAIGRKNWLFGGSPVGAQRAAIFFTLFGGCQRNQINPFDYLLDVALRINDHPAKRLHELLPWNWKPDPQITEK